MKDVNDKFWAGARRKKRELLCRDYVLVSYKLKDNIRTKPKAT
nr:hypothetical protein [Mycoplasmopsis bovis]